MEIFNRGDVIRLHNGEAIVKKSLDSIRGRRRIYFVDYNGERKILKWLDDCKYANEMFHHAIKVVELGSINECFIWPEDITDLQNNGFGYIIPPIPYNYVELDDIILKNYNPEYRHLISASVSLSNAMGALTQNDLVMYGLLSLKINPNNGKILIPEDDLAIVPTATRLSWYDNPKYSAPEVSLGYGTNSYSNRFILARLLFQMLFLSHPFEGMRTIQFPIMTSDVQLQLYAKDPVFIFDRQNHCNAPVPGIQQNTLVLWERAPVDVREIFIKAFSADSIKRPSHRPSEFEFSNVMELFYRMYKDLRTNLYIAPPGFEDIEWEDEEWD